MRLLGWLSAAHPFPLAMVLLLTLLVALASAGRELDVPRLALLLAAMLCSQLAIGWSNDYLDREQDALHQPSKPIPSGVLDARLMPPAIVVVLALALLAGVWLGSTPLLLLIAGTAAGLVYNFGLKATPFSPVPFVVGLALLPPFVWTALDIYRDELLVLYAVATPLAFAAHLANVLPDLETDRAQGRQTLAVTLGRPRTLGLIVVCLLLAPLVTIFSLAWLEYDELLLSATLAAYAILVSAGSWSTWRIPRRSNDVSLFRFLALGSVLFAAGWLASV
jgi:4-hydroxybenzoate polyprenyltransferase